MIEKQSLHFLLVDDDRADRGLVKRCLRMEFKDPDIREVETRDGFLRAIDNPPDLIISDYLLRGFTGLEVLEILRQRKMDIPVILLTGTGNEEVAIEAMKKGAADYVIKTIEHIKRLPATVEQALRLKQFEEDRRMAEEELLLSDQILNSMPDAILLTDLEGRIVRWVGGAKEVFGYSPGEIVGKPGRILHAQAPPSPVQPSNEAGAGEDAPRRFEALCRRRDGVQFPAEVSLTPLQDRTGGHAGWVWVYRDITERKRLEDELRRHTLHLGELVEQRTARIQELQRQKTAMEKLAATGQMAARVAHEINNPLAGIKNAFTLIRREIPPDNRYFSYIELIKKEIDRIAGIIQQMYKSYSPKAGKPSTFNLAVTVSDVCRLLASKARQHDLHLITHLPGDPVQVNQPEGEVNQILYNLILNAIQASPAGRNVEITVKPGRRGVTVLVADSGIGIPQEDQKRIFEPFFTTKTSGSQGGLGLGLAVSQNLAESMGGSITVESEPGRGSIFTLFLPITYSNELTEKEMLDV